MELDKEILRGYIDPIILSILAREDSYGYEIAKEAKRLSDEAFELKEGTLYVAFKRLEKTAMSQVIGKKGRPPEENTII